MIRPLFQVLRFGVDRVDAVLMTHVHADHVNGFDDLRSFCNLQRGAIPVYGAPETMEVIGRHFAYTQCPPAEGTTVPKVLLKPVVEPFCLDEVEVVLTANDRVTLRVGGTFLKVDADGDRSAKEAEAIALAPVPTPEVLWHRPPVLALAALTGRPLDRLGEPSTGSPQA